MKIWIVLAVWILVSLLPGFAGSRFQPGDWYDSLIKPSFNPPAWVFAPVWTALYVLMGVAAWLVWKESGFAGARAALVLFLVQLVLNGLWSYLFFGLHSPFAAFLEIVVLWALILLTTVLFWRVRPLAGIMMLPYIAWVSFASVLNYSLWQLNPYTHTMLP
jgi:translocator protein